MQKEVINHFHCIKNGCEIIIHYKKPRFGVVHIDYVKCKTHNKKICKCGWEWHWHNGENSCKLFPKGKQERQTFDIVLQSSIIN